MAKIQKYNIIKNIINNLKKLWSAKIQQQNQKTQRKKKGKATNKLRWFEAKPKGNLGRELQIGFRSRTYMHDVIFSEILLWSNSLIRYTSLFIETLKHCWGGKVNKQHWPLLSVSRVLRQTEIKEAFLIKQKWVKNKKYLKVLTF